METEEKEYRIVFSSLPVDDDEDADQISTGEDIKDEYDTSTDEDIDECETSTEEEEGDDDGGDDGPPIHFAEDLTSPPEWILLDVRGYIDARKNATTAYACVSTGRGNIQVTFWAARPPRVSCFTIHCDGVISSMGKHGDCPLAIAAVDDLVHLRVPRRNLDDNDLLIWEYFVYQAAFATSTLRLLAVPRHIMFADGSFGILRLRGGDGDASEFLIAAIHAKPGLQCNLHMFNSRTWTWTSSRIRVDRPERLCMSTAKVLAMGGERGSMAWVDLWQGILLCDLLAVDENNKLRYIPLPPSSSTERQGCPSSVRDIAVVECRIKLFEMRFKVRRRAITSTTSLVTRYCEATRWVMKTDPWEPRWRKDCGLDIFKVPVDKAHPELPTHLHDMGKLQGGHPALSLHQEDVVYIMAKGAKGSKRKAWILAVDVRNKTLRDVATFDDARRAYADSLVYLQSGMSNYLKVESSNR